MIYLMRHGESTVNVEHRLTCRKLDGDLTANGREQAEKAARWFVGKGLTRIVSSPFARAQQTAQIVGAAVGLTPTVDAGLGEMDCGDLDWRIDEAGWALWFGMFQRWLKHEPEARYPGGESYAEAVARVQQSLARVAVDETVLLVTHGGVTLTVIPPLCVNAAALQKVEHLVNTGIIVLEHDANARLSCSAWNLAEHLDRP